MRPSIAAGMLVLLAGCHGGDDGAEKESNPFDDWGPYKGCEQDIVYTDYDVYDPDAGPYPGNETVYLYTAQGGVLQRDEYDFAGTLFETGSCTYDERSHAPLGCEDFYVYDKKLQLAYTDTYGYRADGALAWQSTSAPNWWLYVQTVTRDGSDRIVRVDTDQAPTDAKGDADLDGIPDSSDVWIYDGDDTIPTEVDSYRNGIIEDEYLTAVVRYTAENDEIVHEEHVTPDGVVAATIDYTYDDDGHLLTDVRDGGWETYTFTWDGDFVIAHTHEIAWKVLSDVRTDFTAAFTYDCETP